MTENALFSSLSTISGPWSTQPSNEPDAELALGGSFRSGAVLAQPKAPQLMARKSPARLPAAAPAVPPREQHLRVGQVPAGTDPAESSSPRHQ